MKTLKRFHVITGMPRAGSTLLCNILSQNPDLEVSSTSHIPTTLAAITRIHSTSSEVMSLDIRDHENTKNKIKNSLQQYVEGWYFDSKKDIIIDKSRLWSNHSGLLRSIFPNAKIILLVRDIRAIIDSIERRYLDTAYLDDAKTLAEKTIWTRVHQSLSPNGVVGRCIVGIEDMIQRNVSNVLAVKYEDFVTAPEITLGQIYEHLGLDNFDHDLDSIENQAQDVDAIYLHKYPHEGCGQFIRKKIGSKETLSLPPAICTEIIKSFPIYNQTFGYQ